MMNLDFAKFEFRKLAYALVLVLASHSLFAMADKLDPNGCGLTVMITGINSRYGEYRPVITVSPELIKILTDKGYKVSDSDSSGSYLAPDFYLNADLSVSRAYYDDSAMNVELDVQLSKDSFREYKNSIFYRKNAGRITCRQWDGWKHELSSLSNPLNVFSVIDEFNNRCGQDDQGNNLGIYDYINNRAVKLITKHFTDAPDCAAAKASNKR